METFQQMFNEFSNLGISSSRHNIIITHIIDPGNFFVRQDIYTPLIENIENMKHLVKLTKVKIDQMIIFEFKSAKGTKYARGQIITAINNSFSVYAVDYGFCEDSVHLDRIWKCKTWLSIVPEMAINCKLSECTKIGHENWINATKVFKQEGYGHQATMIIRDKELSKLVVRILIDGWNDVALHLLLLGLTFC